MTDRLTDRPTIELLSQLKLELNFVPQDLFLLFSRSNPAHVSVNDCYPGAKDGSIGHVWDMLA